MRRLDRLFEIIQILRSENRSVTALELAQRLEVSQRTVYRDIQALQSMRTPIDGEAGVGYMMRSGYDLPPINFTTSEVEAIVVGLNMLGRTGDQELHRAAQSVASKIESVREKMDSLQTSSWGAAAPDNVDPALLRTSIRNEQKLRLVYSDDKQCVTRRTVLPIAVVYYIEVIVLVAWCELRKSFRHFRVDRMSSCEPLQKYFRRSGAKLRQQWQQENDVD